MTNSGYDIEKRSCRKPGTVISSVRIQPPATALRSSTQTRLPLRTSIAAQTSELMPLPTITTSTLSMIGPVALKGPIDPDLSCRLGTNSRAATRPASCDPSRREAFRHDDPPSPLEAV